MACCKQKSDFQPNLCNKFVIYLRERKYWEIIFQVITIKTNKKNKNQKIKKETMKNKSLNWDLCGKINQILQEEMYPHGNGSKNCKCVWIYVVSSKLEIITFKFWWCSRVNEILMVRFINLETTPRGEAPTMSKWGMSTPTMFTMYEFRALDFCAAKTWTNYWKPFDILWCQNISRILQVGFIKRENLIIICDLRWCQKRR